jgi:hypothetical protein
MHYIYWSCALFKLMKLCFIYWVCSGVVAYSSKTSFYFIIILDVESLYLAIELLTPSGLTLRLATVDFSGRWCVVAAKLRRVVRCRFSIRVALLGCLGGFTSTISSLFLKNNWTLLITFWDHVAYFIYLINLKLEPIYVVGF